MIERRVSTSPQLFSFAEDAGIIDNGLLTNNPMHRLNPEDWQQTAEDIFSQIRDQGLPVTFAFGDADNVKYVNDSLGHDVGDELLSAIDSAIRSTDLVSYGARVGGDEWRVLSCIDHGGALKLKTRIKQSVDDYLNLERSRPLKQLGAGVSIGVATALPYDEISLAELLRQADEDMYLDKQASCTNLNRRQLLGVGVARFALGVSGLSPGQFAKYLRTRSN